MRAYEPSPYTALSVYMFAAAHHFNVPMNVTDYPGMSNIVESAPGEFHIRIQEHDKPEQFAICTYIPHAELWHVRLPDDAVLIVREDYDHFTVVGG